MEVPAGRGSSNFLYLMFEIRLIMLLLIRALGCGLQLTCNINSEFADGLTDISVKYEEDGIDIVGLLRVRYHLSRRKNPLTVSAFTSGNKGSAVGLPTLLRAYENALHNVHGLRKNQVHVIVFTNKEIKTTTSNAVLKLSEAVEWADHRIFGRILRFKVDFESRQSLIRHLLTKHRDAHPDSAVNEQEISTFLDSLMIAPGQVDVDSLKNELIHKITTNTQRKTAKDIFYRLHQKLTHWMTHPTKNYLRTDELEEIIARSNLETIPFGIINNATLLESENRHR